MPGGPNSFHDTRTTACCIAALWLSTLCCLLPGPASGGQTQSSNESSSLASDPAKPLQDLSSGRAVLRVSFGPDGSLAVISTAAVYRDGPDTKLTLFAPDCLGAPRPSDCGKSFDIAGRRPAFTWRPDGGGLFVLSGAHWAKFSKQSSEWRQSGRGVASADLPGLPRILDARAFNALPDLKVEPRGDLEDAFALLSPTGGAAAWDVVDGESRFLEDARTGRRIALPRYVYDSSELGPTHRPLQILPIGRNGDLQLWSSNLGRVGRLMLVTRSGIAAREPTGPGPWSLVELPDGTALGFHSLDGVSGPEWPLGRRLNAFVRGVRRAEPALELRGLAVGPDRRASVVLFGDPNLGWRLDYCVMAPGRCRTIAGERAARPVISSVEPVTLQGGLPARFFRSSAGSHRGIVLYFQGGPGGALDEISHAPVRLLAGYGFDVLAVGYAGTSGHGARNYLRLDEDIIDSLGADLANSASWARKRSGRVGFYGASFGGVAGLSEATTRRAGLDFIILDSPLIEVRRDCSNWRLARIFGRQGQGASCHLPPLDLPLPPQVSRTPVFLLSGEMDPATPSGIAMTWQTRHRASGGCVTALRAAGGGHGMEIWPASAREQAEAELARWLVGAMTPDACPNALKIISAPAR